jgi:hypothetical protein
MHLPRRYAVHALAAAGAVLLVAACTDRSDPVSPGPRPPTGPGSGPTITIQAVQCSANRQAGTINCGLPASANGLPSYIIVGGQGVLVQLTTSNVNYNSGTGQFTFDMTLQNLIEQPIGTIDGTSADPAGSRIFLQTGPTVTSGTGIASVLPDGFDTFTAAGQPYYAYVDVLSDNETSAARTWTFIMPPTVLTFEFTLFVSAPVEYPDGYITLDGNLPGFSYGNLHPGDTHGLAAVVKSATGSVLGGTVTFGTTDPLCATVSGGGVVTGVRAATCGITATSGLLGGEMSFDVTGTVRTWDGSASTDWSAGANWVGDLAPATVDSVLIPTGVPNFPALVANTSIGGVDVADNATLTLGAFNLTSDQNVATGPTAGSGILSTTGVLQLAGTGKTVHGRVPTTLVTGSYSLSGNIFGIAPQTVDAGTLEGSTYELQFASQ